MLQSRRPSSSRRPRCPFKEAAAAEAEWSARLQRRERRPRARPERPSVGAQPCPAPGEPARSGAERQPQTPRDVRRLGAPRAAAAASPSGFLFLSEVFSPTPLLLLLVLPPPCPLPSLRPSAAVTATGRELVVAKPLGPLRGIFAPGGGAHWAKGRRGTREEGSGGQSGSGGRGRSCIGAGRFGEAGPPGKPQLGLLGRARGWNIGRRWRGGGCPELVGRRAR